MKITKYLPSGRKREAGERIWKIILWIGNKEFVREIPPEILLPFGTPAWRVGNKMPAEPFAVSVCGCIYHPVCKGMEMAVFEININTDKTHIFHEIGRMRAEENFIPVEENRIGDLLVEVVKIEKETENSIWWPTENGWPLSIAPDKEGWLKMTNNNQYFLPKENGIITFSHRSVRTGVEEHPKIEVEVNNGYALVLLLFNFSTYGICF